MTLADRIVVLQAGRIEQVGSPMELYERPGNIFVAGFIGSPKMNFITGAPAEALKAKTIGVRPEHFEISGTQGMIAGKVDYTEVLGADSFLYIATDHGMMTARENGKTAFTNGSKIYLSPIAAQTHRFDGDGKRIAG
jgi:multiple sugar transport system ATP-binding protein